MDVFIEIAKTASAESDKIVLLLMECFGWYFFYEEPKTMTVNADAKRKSEMLGTIKTEHFKKAALKKKHLAKRHNRFGGTIVKKTIGGKQMFIHGTSKEEPKLSGESYSMRIHATWKHKGKAATRKYVNDKTRKCAMAVADAFLEQGFNPFIKICREYFEPKQETQLQDEGDKYILYLKFLGFCMEYHRIRERMHYEKAKRHAKKTNTDPPQHCYNGAHIERILNMEFVNFLLANVDAYLKSRKTKMLHQAPVQLIENVLYALKEYVRAVYSMTKYGDQLNHHNGRILIRNLTYEKSIVDLLHRTLKDFNPNKSDRAKLEVLIECSYYLLTMIEDLATAGALVMKYKRKKSKKRKKKEAEPVVVLPEEPEENILLQPKESNGGESKNKVDEGSDKADVNIGEENGEPSAQQAPPSAQSNQDVDDEKMQEEQSQAPPVADPAQSDAKSPEAGQMDVEGSKEAEDKPENPEKVVSKEGEDVEDLPMLDGYEVNGMKVDLNGVPEGEPGDVFIEKDKKEEFETILDLFATNKFISDCFLLLEHFEDNSDKMNYYIITLFKKIAWGIKLYPIFFQLRVFDFFDRFYGHPLTISTKKYDSIKKFGQSIMRKFFKHCESNPVLYAEALFFKKRQTLDEIKDPGHKRKMDQIRDQKKAERERKRMQKRTGDIFGEPDSDEEYVNSLNEAKWTELEIRLLQDNYPIYADDGSYLIQLQNILEMDASSSRTEAEIERQLIRMELRPKPRKRKKRKVKQRKDVDDLMEPKWKRKVKLPSVKETLISIAHRAKQKEEEEAGVKWLIGKMSSFSLESVTAKEKIGQDLAIVPVQREEFHYLESRSLAQIFGALNFFGPSKTMGTTFWRVPGTYTKGEVQQMTEIFQEGLDKENISVNQEQGILEQENPAKQDEEPDIAGMMNEAFAGVSLVHSELPETIPQEENSQEKVVLMGNERSRNPKRPFEDDSDSDDEIQLHRLQKKRKIIDDEDE